MNQFRKAGILLVIGLVIILARNYEEKQNKKIAIGSRESAGLIRVVDGDTIVVRINGNDEKIRIIGINTPESVKKNSPIECFGKEATLHMKQLLSEPGGLRTEADPTQDIRDKYGRLLSHVFVGDSNIGQQMIADGYAYENTYNKPYIYQSEYRTAQRNAQKNNLGLWSPDTCNGKK